MYPHWISHMNYELVKNKAKKKNARCEWEDIKQKMFFQEKNPDHFEEETEAIVIKNT